MIEFYRPWDLIRGRGILGKWCAAPVNPSGSAKAGLVFAEAAASRHSPESPSRLSAGDGRVAQGGIRAV